MSASRNRQSETENASLNKINAAHCMSYNWCVWWCPFLNFHQMVSKHDNDIYSMILYSGNLGSIMEWSPLHSKPIKDACTCNLMYLKRTVLIQSLWYFVFFRWKLNKKYRGIRKICKCCIALRSINTCPVTQKMPLMSLALRFFFVLNRIGDLFNATPSRSAWCVTIAWRQWPDDDGLMCNKYMICDNGLMCDNVLMCNDGLMTTTWRLRHDNNGLMCNECRMCDYCLMCDNGLMCDDGLRTTTQRRWHHNDSRMCDDGLMPDNGLIGDEGMTAIRSLKKMTSGLRRWRAA